MSFRLQPHVGGAESPLTRTRKVYGLSAPRWVARLLFRGGYNGRVRTGEPRGFGARLDALIADLDGGLNIIRFPDWRRPRPSAGLSIVAAPTSLGAAKGATSMTVAGFAPYSVALSVGDYLGGDGRPHLVSAMQTLAAGGKVVGAGSILADADGRAVVGFRPPLSAAIPAGAVLRWPVTAPFQLASEDAGDNEVQVGQAVDYSLDFVEFLP